MNICELLEDLKCPICLNYAIEPCECTKCTQVMCTKCIKMAKNKCPVCRNNKKFIRSKFAQKVLVGVKIECTQNCGELVRLNDLKTHSHHCRNKIMECVHCTFSGKREDFIAHINQTHMDAILNIFENKSFNN